MHKRDNVKNINNCLKYIFDESTEDQRRHHQEEVELLFKEENDLF